MTIKQAGSDAYNKWALSSYLENLKMEKWQSINITTFHKSLTDFLKGTPDPAPYLGSIEDLALSFEKALKKVDRQLITYRDDFLSTACRLYSLLDNKKKVKQLIEDTESGAIENVHKEFVLQKLYKYSREGENYCNVNKRWRKALSEYRRSSKGKDMQRATTSFTSGTKAKDKKGFFQKLFSIFGS